MTAHAGHAPGTGLGNYGCCCNAGEDVATCSHLAVASASWGCYRLCRACAVWQDVRYARLCRTSKRVATVLHKCTANCTAPFVLLQSYCSNRTAGDTIARPYILGKEARRGDKPQGLADMMPDWVGYLTLYGISAIPVLLVVATVTVLFINSLK